MRPVRARPQGRNRFADVMRANRAASRAKRRDAAISGIEKRGSDALSSASKRGGWGSMAGGMIGGKLGTMALGGLLGMATGGVINPWTLQALTTGAQALGSGIGAWGASKAAMGKPDIGKQEFGEFADLRDTQRDTQDTLQDAVNAKALKYGTSAAASSAAQGALKGLGGYQTQTGVDTSTLPEGMSQWDYDQLVYDRQNAWAAGGGDAQLDVEW